jgi:hypothetical protein
MQFTSDRCGITKTPHSDSARRFVTLNHQSPAFNPSTKASKSRSDGSFLAGLVPAAIAAGGATLEITLGNEETTATGSVGGGEDFGFAKPPIDNGTATTRRWSNNCFIALTTVTGESPLRKSTK